MSNTNQPESMDTSLPPEIGPCPFCGKAQSEAHLRGNPDDGWFVTCPSCCATGPGHMERVEAVKLWCKRSVGVLRPFAVAAELAVCSRKSDPTERVVLLTFNTKDGSQVGVAMGLGMAAWLHVLLELPEDGDKPAPPPEVPS